jgi:acetylornithine deacetylase/succinyl-diaminopimelate desuccinylase-like protein
MISTSTAPDAALEGFLDDHQDERMASYEAFLRIPSISVLPQHAADCRAAAGWLAAELRRIGVEHVDVSETGGHPIVYGDWLHAGDAPTAVVYGHYDVQPVDPVDLWHKAPFEPVVEGRRLLARGAADDKGQVHMHLKATEAILATREALPVNLRFVFEGEEEATPVHLEPWLEANRHRLAADFVLISDTGFFDGNRPALATGMRGLMYAQIDVTGSPVDLHSGSYGGAVANPANALAELIAGLKGPDGRIRIAGFYDDVVSPTEGDREALARLPFDEETFRESLDLPELVGEPGYTTLERRGARPTLDVNGIWGGFQGEGGKTIIPAHAHAKVSCRLVPNQTPERVFELFRAHVEANAPRGVRTSVQNIGGGYPVAGRIDHPATQAAARAIRSAFGAEPVYIREGGSIPFAAMIQKMTGRPIVLMGFTPPDDNAHAPNESMDLDNYERGIRAIARLWDEVAALDPGILRGAAG